MKTFLKVAALAVLMIVMTGIGFAAGIFVDRPSALVPVTGRETATGSPTQTLDMELIEEAYDVIQENYADREAVQETNLTYAAIGGMVDALGDTGHSRFLTPEMVAAEQRAIAGELEGIGALLQIKDDLPVILAPMDNSPAQKAGLRPGDIILEVNGENVTELSLSEIVARVTGPAGTDVTLTIQDPDTEETREVTITRARIEIQNVTWQMLPGTQIAHVRIASFSQDVANNLRSALREAQRQGARGVILDLRNNPGGLLSQAIGVASHFLSEGNVLIQQDAQGEQREVPVRAGGVATEIPLVVLINEGSASAAEIVAGALQDYDRATLVGETTFGTGTVLLTFPLDDGSALLLATELWLTPKGRDIWHEGISPDIPVDLPDDTSPSIPETERDWQPEDLQEMEDTQLKRAIEVLQDEVLPAR